MKQLAAHHVEARDYYNPPLHRHPYFERNPGTFGSMDLSATEDLCERIISVPIHDDMAPEDVDTVIRALASADPAASS